MYAIDADTKTREFISVESDTGSVRLLKTAVIDRDCSNSTTSFKIVAYNIVEGARNDSQQVTITIEVKASK